MFEVLGFVFEGVFLGMGIYLLLLASGRVKAKSPDAQARMEAFRQENKTWLLIGGIALVLVMGGALMVHILQVVG